MSGEYEVTVDVTRLDATPNPAPLDAELNLEIDYTTSADIPGAKWEIRYVVDMAANRYVIAVGEGEVADVEKGANAFRFHSPGMELDGVKKSWLNNVGLLLAVLLNANGEEMIQVSMVTQVMKGSDGKLERFVISPLE